jgi:hypothetical protein
MRFLTITCLTFLFAPNISAAPQVKEDNLHVRSWNQFAQNALKFHRQRIKNLDVNVKEKIGGYSHLPDYYLQKDYFVDGKLIATVMWERENPEQLHSIEVFIHDKKGRVIRDYIAAYLPHYHNAPTQTLISFHNYNNGLHAFRSFDASGYRIIERCSGSYKGRDVEFILDEDEIAVALDDTYVNKGIMVSEDYKNCFADLQQDVGEYITPH